MVVDALSHMTIGSVSYIDEAKKDLAKEVHRMARLVVSLEGYPNWGAIVHHNSESSLVFKVKSEQHLDLALMEFKEFVLDKLNE